MTCKLRCYKMVLMVFSDRLSFVPIFVHEHNPKTQTLLRSVVAPCDQTPPLLVVLDNKVPQLQAAKSEPVD